MTYRVLIMPHAERDIDDVCRRIAADSPSRAARWQTRLLKAITRLKRFPRRCEVAPESAWFHSEIRQLLFGRRQGVYRILFSIAGDKISVFHIRHAAQDFLSPSEGYILGE